MARKPKDQPAAPVFGLTMAESDTIHKALQRAQSCMAIVQYLLNHEDESGSVEPSSDELSVGMGYIVETVREDLDVIGQTLLEAVSLKGVTDASS